MMITRENLDNLKLERFVPWLVLVILAIYTYAKFFKIPYLGFVFTGSTVRLVYDSPSNPSIIKTGDRIIQFGSVLMESYEQDTRLPISEEINPGDSIPIIVERGGQVLSVNWKVPDLNLETLLKRIIGPWLMAYVLWLAGTATLLFHRPKDGRWLHLSSFYYLLAILFIVSTGPSTWHVWKGAWTLRSAVWFGLPVFIHFHWAFPEDLRKLPKLFWFMLYGFGIVFAVAEWLNFLPINAYIYSLYAILIGCFLLLILHYLFQPELRKRFALLNDAYIVLILSSLMIGLTNFSGLNFPYYALGGIVLALLAIPGAYFLISYWDQIQVLRYEVISIYQRYLWFVLLCTGIILILAFFEVIFGVGIPILTISSLLIFLILVSSTISFLPFILLPVAKETRLATIFKVGTQIRANKLLSSWLFFLLLGFFYSLLIVNGIFFINTQFSAIFLGIGSVLSAIVITLSGYPTFQKYVERRLLGIDIPTDELLQSYVENISNSLNRNNLLNTIIEKVLPSLLIRESALLSLIDGQVKVLFTYGINREQIPDSSAIISYLDEVATIDLQNKNELLSHSWIILAFPLRVNQTPQGIWLLGGKDPDDFYTLEEIAILKSIANQTAIALAKIQHKEHLDLLLQENIYRAEQERNKLARDLHDEVLNGLVVLGMTLDDQLISPDFEAQFSLLTTRIRRIISGLRPPSLEQGLWFALKEKANEIQRHVSGSITVDFDIPYSVARYEQGVEGHIYRIIQQACDNALVHARAKNIRIFGELTQDKFSLRVEDDGRGFHVDRYLQEPQDDSFKHYGLTLMHERAELIGANLFIHSTPRQGTRVQLKLNNLTYQRDEHLARLKAEKALWEREQSFREFLETSSFGVLINNNDFKIIFANERAAEISGYSIPQLLRLSIEDLATPQEFQQIKTFQNNEGQGKFSDPLFETIMQRIDGSIIPVEMTVTQTLWDGKEAGIAFFSDISVRKQIEETLYHSEANLFKIFDNAIDGIVLVDKTGKHLFVNERYAEMTGFTVSELLERSMSDMIEEESLEKVSQRFVNRFTGEKAPVPFEIILKKKDGTRFPIIGISTKITWQGQEVLLGYMRDITKQRQVEEKLRLSEDRFKTLIDTASDGILVSDHTGRHIYANVRAAEISGYPMAELLNLSFRQFVHPEEVVKIEDIIQDAINGNLHTVQEESRILTKTGDVIPVEFSSSVTFWGEERVFIIIFRDISQRKLAEETLRISEEKFRAIVDNANDGILVADETGNHIYANNRASEITGYSRDELFGTTIKDLAHPDHFETVRKRFRSRITDGSAPRQYETMILTKGGEPKAIEITAAKTNWENKPAILVIIRDVSDRR